MNKEKALKSLLPTLPGKKVLCRGNHDGYPRSQWGDWEWFMKCGFDFVTDYFVYQDLAFSHAPLTPLPLTAKHNYAMPIRLNIHGHFHRGHTRIPQKDMDENMFQDEFYNYKYYKMNKEKYRLVQIEDTLSPFLLEDVLKET